MQTVAQSWLVLELGASPTMLGLIVALQALPYLLAGPYGGLIADRFDKRLLLIYTQAALGLLALVLGLLVVAGVVQLWQVFVLAGLTGLVGAVATPARQTIVAEIVHRDSLATAVTLNSVMTNGARAVGPAIAGIVIAGIGTGPCFLINAATFVAVIISLVSLDRAALRPAPLAPRKSGQIMEGLRYAAGTPRIAIPLLMMAVVGTLAYEFQVSLPVMARDVFGGEPQTYGWMNSALGVGAIVGGLVVASRPATGVRRLEIYAVAFGIGLVGAALATNLVIELVALAIAGAASVSFMSVGNATLQLAADPAMRGRVIALWTAAFVGTTPIGGPIVGWIAEVGGGRWAIAVGGAACLATAGLGWAAKRRWCMGGKVAAVEAPTIGE